MKLHFLMNSGQTALQVATGATVCAGLFSFRPFITQPSGCATRNKHMLSLLQLQKQEKVWITKYDFVPIRLPTFRAM